ncbi:MAG: plasmid pRiA4b ORF-3 family protein [Clostridiales bacterium]|jgi:hypothetical protein|nr:plasmid pRiA4b ORF-3 family protein [Clostridiales bacterium]
MPPKNPHADEYNNLINIITQLFIRRWNNGLKKMRSPKSRMLVRRYMPAIFRRWYFSALIEDSHLTPANLVEALNGEYGFPALRTPRPLGQKNDKPGQGPSFELADFNGDTHPFVDDMRYFLDSLNPAFDATALREGRIRTLTGLSQDDPGYLEFLLEACVRLKLIKLTPSIKNDIGLVNGSYKRFFDNSPTVILRRVIDAATDLTVQRLSEILPIKKTFKSKLISYLKRPKSIDKIFDDIFYDSGIDILKLFEDFSQNSSLMADLMSIALDGADIKDFEDHDLNNPGIDSASAQGNDDTELNMQAEIMTGAFFLGVELDKCFLTPLGYYLRVIQPMYIIPFDVEEELESIGDMLKGMDEPAPLIHAPCSEYTLTGLGNLIMNTTAASTAPNAQDAPVRPQSPADYGLPEGPALKKFIQSLESIIGEASQAMYSEERPSNILALKLLDEKEPRLWINAEIPQEYTLSSLHLFITRIFNKPEGNDYSFFTGGKENPFSEYKPGGGPGRQTDRVTLADLILGQGDELLYCSYTVDNIRRIRRKCFGVNIRVINVTERIGDSYPRISRRSRALTEIIRG